MSVIHFPEEEIRKASEVLPVTMSLPLRSALAAYERENYKDTMTNLLDFFEMSVQWLNCYFLGLCSEHGEGARQKGVIRAVRTIDRKRPLSFGDSVNELFNPLLESIRQLYPDHPLVISLLENVKTRRTDILTGSAKSTGVVKIRNDYKGHSTSLSQSIYRNVVETLAPKAEAMLKGLAPLTEARVWAVGSNKEVFVLNGYLKLSEEETALSLNEPRHYFVDFAAYPTVDLFPLVIFKDDSFVYIFQTLKGEEVRYESSDENVHGYETESLNTEFDRFMQKLLPGFDISKESNWKELCECMHLHSAEYMMQVQKEKKYNGDLFVDREHLSRLFNEFSASSFNLLPLSGDAGQGKTNQLCHWTETFLDSSTPVLVFSGSAFADLSLVETLKTIFGVSFRKPLRRLLQHLHSKAEEEDRNVYFFFDAVNECLRYKGSAEADEADGVGEDAPLRLFSDIVDHLVSAEYPRFKVITTCRSFTWKNQIMPRMTLPEDRVFGDGLEDSVIGFTDKETEAAYQKYGELYQMSTSFGDIDRRIVLRLRDPLVLKFVCSNYVGSKISSDLTDYTSVKLFDKMLTDIRDHTFAGRKQCVLLEELATILMQSYLAGEPAGSITNLRLREAVNNQQDILYRLANMIYKKDGLTAAYTELRNKPDRPILREVVKTQDGENIRAVEFIYERFLEYMMARVFIDTHGNRLSAELVAEAFSRAAVNVVFMGMMRNAILIDIDRTHSYALLINLISGYGDNPHVAQLVGEVFDVLIRENYEADLFSLLIAILDIKPDDRSLVPEFNMLKQQIASNKATSEVILRHNELGNKLRHVISLRNSAIVAVNNMLLSDFFNEGLYRKDVLALLWRLINDDIVDVSNETCKFVYYLSRKRTTLTHSPLSENLAKRIVKAMYADIRSRTLMGNVVKGDKRKRSMIFVETATRLAVLLLIDATVTRPQNKPMISEMLAEINGIAGYFTWNYRLVRAIMPFLQSIMRKQITFQSAYVNNAVEYQGFWDDTIVPYEAEEGVWSRKRLKDAMDFVGFFNRHHDSLESEEHIAERERFRKFLPVMMSAYVSGCSFSYFIMERILIIAGSTDWQLVREIFTGFLDKSRENFEWFDYLQMSLLYNLFQLELNSLKRDPEILEILSREARDWTERCRGLFKARHSHKANPTGVYKRNVITWYCVAYCSSSGDNVAHEGDDTAVPMLYELIDKAVDENDKELLFHLIDNIAELISDSGYIATALAAVKYVMTKYDTEESVRRLNDSECSRGRYKGETLLGRIGNVLGLAKTYFPAETDAFLRSDVIGLKFPGVENFREEILNYHSGGETLSDLFTHRFGNFLLWSLLHEKEVDDFSHEAVCAAIESKDCFVWFDQVIRILFRYMFNVKI